MKKNRDKGLGCVQFDKNRSKPYRAKVYIGAKTDSKGRIQSVYRTLGNFYTKSEAEAALQEFARSPFDLSLKINTFSDLYSYWIEELRKTKPSDAYIRTMESAYSYCRELYDMPLKNIGAGHIKDHL